MTRVALILAIVLAAAAPAAGQGTCTLDQLAGTYVFESRGQSALA